MKKILIFYFLLLLGGYKNLFGISLEKSEPVRTASELIKLCSSSNPDMVSYCEGYIESALYSWKLITACSSPIQSNQSFCLGAESAQKAIQKALTSCNDCNIRSFKPELKDNTIRGRLFIERMQKFSKELNTSLGVCSPNEEYNKHYCTGYNLEVKNTITNYFMTYSRNLTMKPKDMGMGHATDDLGVHLFTSAELMEFVPCINKMFSTEEAKNVFLKFMHDNPEQRIDTTALIALEKSLYYNVCPGRELGWLETNFLKPHMEQCTKLEYENGYYKTKNNCSKSVHFNFWEKGQKIIARDLKPGESFKVNPKSGSWMFTTCPVGYISSVELSEDNTHIIRASQYSCIKK